MRNLVIILGDQLNHDSAAFDGFESNVDCVWMAEVAEESTHVWSHKARTTLFLSAMRHFERDLTAKRHCCVLYRHLNDPSNTQSLASELKRSIRQYKPKQLVVVEPGDHRVREILVQAAEETGVPLEIREDRHFYASIADFRKHMQGRKQLRLEFFYRELRQRFQVLMRGGKPVGGAWNFDAANRGAFGKQGPGVLRAPIRFVPDRITKEVMQVVERTFPDHPGELSEFNWPVTPDEAVEALDDFLQHRLPMFGQYQDAMWTGQPFLYHSRLAAAMNLKILDPRVVVEAAERAYYEGKAPLEAVEGFIRQILGWREYVRGIYHTMMPEYLERNALQATKPLPKFFWTGETEMQCLAQTIQQTLRYGYAHHIQRLMVTGLYCLLEGVDPKQVHEWYLAVYVDAVEWVELPNTLGMSQYADGGVMASKPYVATGKYIQRMSNYCGSCKYDPEISTGPTACPFTQRYWQFLERHEKLLNANPRMKMQLNNLRRRQKPSGGEAELIPVAALTGSGRRRG